MSHGISSELSAVQSLSASGHAVEAYDRARAALDAGARDSELLHLAALNLARCGAPSHARELLAEHADLVRDDEEFGSLQARLHKDEFRRLGPTPEGLAAARSARDRYLDTFRKTGGYFPAINAATLSFLMGDTKTAGQIAERTIEICSSQAESYWTAATMAEANLLLGRDDKAKEFLARAAYLARGDHASRGTTCRQLRLICGKRGIAPAILAPLRPPAAVHFTGAMIHGIGRNPGMDPDDAPALRARADDLLRRQTVGFAYGALACGADILIAEALLAHGAELHVILPFAPSVFKQTSVEPAGPDWTARFDAALAAAHRVVALCEEPVADADVLYGLASRVAMGAALLKSAELDCDVFQIAMRGAPRRAAAAGTEHDLDAWRRLGLRTETLEVPAPRRGTGSAATRSSLAPSVVRRQVRAMVFADVRGYSRMGERELAEFVPLWLDHIARLRARHAAHISAVETWGDAAYFVCASIPVAAVVATDLARFIPDRVRVSLHAGPVFMTHNPALGQPACFGADVNLAARMEPSTPPGEVYTTENFAALLAMEEDVPFACEYIGLTRLAKDYGEARLFHLRAAGRATRDPTTPD